MSSDNTEKSSDGFIYEESDCDNATAIDPEKFFLKKEFCYYKKIHKYYKSCSAKNIDKLIEIISGKSKLSLRILDWFVTKYSKKKIDCGININNEPLDVRISYKSQLKSYKKKYFDPFRRYKKFIYTFSVTDKTIVTTIGQLNFFKWVFTTNILHFVEKNLKIISKEMNLSNKDEKIKKEIKSKSDKTKSDDNSKTFKNKKTPMDLSQFVVKFD
jgi:hypothetical protein